MLDAYLVPMLDAYLVRLYFVSALQSGQPI